MEAVGSEEDAHEVFTHVDLNNDGIISYDEFNALMKVPQPRCTILKEYPTLMHAFSFSQGLNSHSPKYRALMEEPAHPESRECYLLFSQIVCTLLLMIFSSFLSCPCVLLRFFQNGISDGH